MSLTRRSQPAGSALPRLLRLRAIGAWLQWVWIVGPVGLAVLTAAGVVRGGPSHPGLPMAWTPLISVFTGAGAAALVVAAAGFLVRLLAGAAIRRVAGRPAVAADLAARAAVPMTAGERLGRWRLLATTPAAARPVRPPALRLALRVLVGIAGLGLLAAAALPVPAVLSSRGGGGDLLVTAVGGLVLVAIAARRGPSAWCCPAADDSDDADADGAGPFEARAIRRGGGRPGGRRLLVRRRRARPGAPRGAAPVLEIDLPPWPESAVRRHRLAACLPAGLAGAVRGDAERGGAIPGDPGLPPAP